MVGKTQKQEAMADVLKGMDATEAFTGFSRAILMRWKRDYPLMPMNKRGGIYMADPDAMRQFLKDVANGDTEKYLEDPPESADSEDKDESGDQDKDQGKKGK